MHSSPDGAGLFDRTKTACFSGYRPEKFDFPLKVVNLPPLYLMHYLGLIARSENEYVMLMAYIYKALLQADAEGYTTFLCGMSRGFDLLCAEQVINLGGKLVCVIPHEGHMFKDNPWRRAYKRVLKKAPEVITLQPEYSRGCYVKRNKYMIENSSRLICYWDGKRGGTAQTIRMANKAGLDIYNVAEK